MSRITTPHVFTSESVSEGHPDKICDQISDAVLDRCLQQDPDSRVACEALVTTDLVVLAGEITTQADLNFEAIARKVIRDIGYTDPAIGFSADTCKMFLGIHPQSPDISQGVSEGEGAFEEQGAGDQGMMFGYASDETKELMPAPILYAHQIAHRLAELRHNQPETYPFLRPDAKSQVSFVYEDGRPVRLDTVVVSQQHTEDMEDVQLQDLVREVVQQVVPEHFLHDQVTYYTNPTGRFAVGGPYGDSGLTGRKIIVDTYGGVGCHGGGAFSGKDPTKVDRSATYMARYIAKNIVQAGLARKCEVQLAYAIGVPYPVSVNVETFGTSTVSVEKLQEVVRGGDIFDLRPAAIMSSLGLQYPGKGKQDWNYLSTSAYGHFGRGHFPWEQTDKAEELRQALSS